VKVLVANIGSTSLKWRLFDFSNGAEVMLHKGGLERVTDYASAIEDCLSQLKQAGAIQREADLAGVGFKTVIAKNVTGCVRLTEDVLRAMEDYNGLAPAHNPPYIAGIRQFARRIHKRRSSGCLKLPSTSGRPSRRSGMRYRRRGMTWGCDAGAFTGQATSSSPSAARN
jgi:acetate kinase